MTSTTGHEESTASHQATATRHGYSEGEKRIAAQTFWYINARLGKPTSEKVRRLAGEPTRWRRRWFRKLPEWDLED